MCASSTVNKTLFKHLALLLILFALPPWGLAQQENRQSKGNKSTVAEEVFNGPIRRLKITIHDKGVAELKKYHWGGPKEARVNVPATVTEGDKVWTNVA